MDNRGRPKELDAETKPRQFQHKFDNHDGTYDLWIWDLDIFPNGPISTEVIIGETKIEEEISLTAKINEKFSKPTNNEELPLTKRKYFNPESGKWVGYTRAHNLGLV